MSLDLEAINKYRLASGQEPLTALPQAPASIDTPPTDIPTSTKTDEDHPIATELTNDAVLEFLRKNGIEAVSLDDLKKKPEEDPVLTAEKREADILSYGLQKGKFNKKKYESFIKDSSDLQNLVFQHELEEAQKEDADLSLEDFQAEFAAKYGMDTESGTRKNKAGQKNLSIIGNQILQGKYKDIYDTEGEYSTFENNQKVKSETEKKIIAGAPVYKKSLDNVFANLKKITAKVSEEEIYEIEALEESLTNIRSMMEKPEWAAQQIMNGYTEEDLQKMAYARFVTDNLPFLMQEVVKQDRKKTQKGTRGIPVVAMTSQNEPSLLTPEQQKFAAMVNPQAPVAN